MRFYKPHTKFYCEVDLHARFLYLGRKWGFSYRLNEKIRYFMERRFDVE